MIGTTRKKLLPSLLIAVFIAVPLWTATTQAQGSCETPLFLQQNSVDANVLLIFDSSGSMNDAMYHDAFNPQVTYSGSFDPATRYTVSYPGNYRPSDFDWRWTNTVSAYLVNSDFGQPGGYLGNYLNWVYYNATSTQRAAIPVVTRIQVAKAAVNNIVLNAYNIRFGVMRFNGDAGGRLVAPMGTDPTTVAANVNSIAGEDWTPLAETLVSALYYLRDAPEAVEYDCQRTFVLVVTDGFPTQDQNVPSWIGDYDNDGNDPGSCKTIGALEPNNSNCSDYLDDVALYLYENDLRSDLDGVQNAVTYTIGFNIDSGFLAEAASNGGGLYFNANNSTELRESLDKVLTDIHARISSGSAVAVVSSENAEENTLYRAKFMPSRWNGHLEAFALPYAEGDAPLWDAGSALVDRDPGTRSIITSVDGQEVSFDVSNDMSLAPYLAVGIDTDGDGIEDDLDYALADDIINYVRGEDLSGYRSRGNWKLGDIVGSAPVVVGAPRDFHQYNEYLSFRMANENREKVVYVGANDGMLHCFRASDGEELWAYIPQVCLPKLKQLLNEFYCHEYFVDATPKVFDAYVNGYWHTVLLSGQGEGGDSFFAIDVTDPYAPVLMWEKSLPAYGQSWNTPKVARVDGYNEPLVFCGSGPDEVNGEAYLVALDLSTGDFVWDDLLSSSLEMNMATSPVVIDMDFDGFDDLLYVNDLAGHVWRFDLTSWSFPKTLLFSTDQPIQASPTLTVNELGQVMIYFGTGRYIDTSDISDVTMQTFYCIIDNHSGTTVDRYDLADQTGSIQQITPSYRGWYIDLVQTTGERVSKPGTLVAGVVYFTAFQPNAEVCGSGGRSWLYSVDFRDGSAKDNEDGSENDVTEGRIEDLGTGIGSEPVFDIANEQIIVQLNDTRISVQDVEMEIRRLIVRSWREQWN
jgi:type IV pilus assembly protein PilY1